MACKGTHGDGREFCPQQSAASRLRSTAMPLDGNAADAAGSFPHRQGLHSLARREAAVDERLDALHDLFLGGVADGLDREDAVAEPGAGDVIGK